MEPVRRVLRLASPIDAFLTLAPLRHGPADPTIRFEAGSIMRALWTSAGPATVRITPGRGTVEATAWGPGATLALDSLPALLGDTDDPTGLTPAHPVVHELSRRFSRVRMTRTGDVFGALLPAIIEQKVVGEDAHRSYRALVRAFGETAPGPNGLMLPPLPRRLAALPYYAFHPLGIERRRADVIRRAAQHAIHLEDTRIPAERINAALRSLAGIGSWTAAETIRVAYGDADAVSVGDYHLPSLVSWALAREPRATDARMLELLEPYRGQRARVVRLLELGGPRPPAFGPRMARRSIAAI